MGRIAFIDPEIEPMSRIAKIRVNVDNARSLLKPGMFATARVEVNLAADGATIEPDFAGKWISPMHPEIVKDGPGECDICGMALVPATQLGFATKSETNQKGPLSIPENSVLTTGERAVVYLRLPNHSEPTFEGREILLGAKINDRYIVESGLNAGDLVVTRGAFKLDSELQLKAKPSMMNPNAGLIERPAHSAPEDLSGQWEPVRRAYARMVRAVEAANESEVEREIDVMLTAIDMVKSNTFQPDLTTLWREFANRTKNDLFQAKRLITNEPSTAAAMVERSLEEAGRYLGLAVAGKEPIQVDPQRVAELRALMADYFPVAKALANDDPVTASRTANKLAQVAEKIGSVKLAANIRQLAESETLDEQRPLFGEISKILVAAVEAEGLDHVGSVYTVHCPMAFGNEGADWLSAVPEVMNPYFGDSMLTCGTVTNTLSLGSKEIKEMLKPEDIQHE